ncbi:MULTISPECIES: hypothetical protein [Aequorivita]|uniref:Membrane or secreted protein n=1 Tax=Aequorivita iocasae TaxID=2803865 RepID=A0ABX7DYT3_9FLAO|nr:MULTISPECIES: hypothetical protein [Aequorivita]QQX77914.1 hypothetical protein JK629_06540 [Aequorivita iocasae]UCA57414.1 hypothetical protein LDL78_06570 [Aequorivita sp. F7]
MKKYLVLGILFLLPITAYVFFASGENNFATLPTLTPSIAELHDFETLEGKPVQLEKHITVLGFFGSDLEAHRAYAYNLAHKIYSKNHQFNEFQFVILLPKGTEAQARSIEEKLKQIAPTDAWFFAFGSEESIREVFQSLKSNITLDKNVSTPYVFIIDKERSLRGRDDDDDEGIMYGFDSSNIAEINNKMSDDVKVLLAEYRRALKKYNTDREI